MKRRLILWLLRRLGWRRMLVPAGCTLYVPEPSKIDANDLGADVGGRIIYGPIPEPEPFPWLRWDAIDPDPDAPTGSLQFAAAMDLLRKGWRYEGRYHPGG